MITPDRGLWIWHIERIRKDYIAGLKKANCKRVYLKTFDDASAGIFWPDQCNEKIIKGFTSQGIEVYGWGYIFDKRKSTDVAGVVDAVKKSLAAGCTGFVLDAEVELESVVTHEQCKELLTEIRKVVPKDKLGYTSFGNPTSHSTFPYVLFDDFCDFAMPQMYFSLWTWDTDENEVTKAFEQHRKMGLSKPIYPIFTAENKATVEVLQKFLDKFPGSSIYAAQIAQAWELNYRGSESTGSSNPVPNSPVIIPKNEREIIEWKINVADFSDARGFDANGKCVCYLDTNGSIEMFYRSSLAAGAPRARVIFCELPAKGSTIPKTSLKSSAEVFVNYFQNNYGEVRKEVERWFTPKYSPNAVKNSCVAHQTSALKLAGLPFPVLGSMPSINVDYLVTYAMQTLHYVKFTDLSKLQLGDICVSGPSDTNWDHIFCFVSRKSEDIALVLHNQQVGLVERYLKNGNCGTTRFFLRMP